jgi:pilus assembly protein CpaB
LTKKNLIPLAGIAFAVAVVSTWVFYGLVAGREAQTAVATARTVVVAKHDLEAGVRLSPDDLEQVKWSGKESPTDAFSAPAQVVGGRLTAKIAKSVPLTLSIVEIGAAAASGEIPAGMRAISVRASDSNGLMELLTQGSFVDVQAVSRLRQSETTSVKTILRRVPVLNLTRPGEHGLGKNEPAVVTLLVTAADADQVALADSAGKVRLTLRNPSEEETNAPSGIARTSIVSRNSRRVWIDLSMIDLPDGHTTAPGIARAEKNGSYPVVESWKAAASIGSVTTIEREHGAYRVRLRVMPQLNADGSLQAVLEPEISWNAGGATEARRVREQVEFPVGGRYLVSGLAAPASGPGLLISAGLMP